MATTTRAIRRGIIGRIVEAAGEMIGRYGVQFAGGRAARVPVYPSVDHTRPDYAYYDRLRRGKQPTVKIGGMFAKPITAHVKNWTLGRGFKATTGHESTDQALEKFVRKNLRILKDAYNNGLGLGDAYVVVNADGSLSEAPPDGVEPVLNPLDYRKVEAYIITASTDAGTVRDEYRADMRIVKIGQEPEVRYKNLAGRITVCHYANERSVNEAYGHPYVESMLPAMMDYDDIYTKGSAGVKAMSVPIPALEDVTNVEAALKSLGAKAETYTDSAGRTATKYTVDFDRLPFIITPGKFNYKGPASFTEDSWRMLKNLFFLMLQNSGVPEWLWGGAIASSKASVDAQLPGWTSTVADQRSSVEEWLTQICEVWLAITSLSDAKVRALPVEIEWPEITDESKAELRAMIDLLMKYGLVTDETALRLTQMVEDPEAEVQRARDAAEKKRDAAMQIDDWAKTPAGADEDEEDATDDDDDVDAAA